MNKGFTLIEMAVALAVGGTLMMVDLQDSNLQQSEQKAAAYGKEIFAYNAAVGRFISDQSATPDAVVGTYSGSDWLHTAACGGSATLEYLPCLDMASGETNTYSTTPVTTITKTASDGLEARTVWSPIAAEGGGLNTTVMGLAAIAASGAYVSQLDDPAAGSGPSYYCPDIASYASSISAVCQSDKNRLVSISSTSPSTEKWLRVDHANTMVSAIEFDDGSGNPTPTTGAGVSLDDIDGTNLRQIVNVARLYNKGSSGTDSIVLGQMDGNNIYSDSFLTSAGLLSNSIISDGDLAVLGDLHVKMDSLLYGNLAVQGDTDLAGTLDVDGKITGSDGMEITGDIDGSRDINAVRDINADRDIYAKGDITSDMNIEAGNNITANNNIYADNNITAANDINAGRDIIATRDIVAGIDVGARAFYDITATGTIVSYFSGGYVVNPSDDSRIRNVDLTGRLTVNGELLMSHTYSEGSSCSPNGLIGKMSDGTAMSCVSGSWKRFGGNPTLSCTSQYVSKYPPTDLASATGSKYCPTGYTRVGFDTSGENGKGITGGSVGDRRSWAFCCKIDN